MKTFLSLAGSYLKAFLAIVIAFIISKGSIANLDWWDLLSTCIVSFLPVLIKALSGAEDGFFNTVVGGYVKTLVTVALAYIVSAGTIYGLNWQELVNTAIMALLPVLLNIVNPADTRYGVIK